MALKYIEQGTEQFFEKDGKPWKRVWEQCWRCSGKGVIPHFFHVASGVCFKCGDAKGYWVECRVLNEKEQARRDATKARKAAKREQEAAQRLADRNTNFMEKIGFAGQCIHVVAIKDTFPMADELKAAGAKFRKEYGWYFSQPTDLYPTIELTKEEGILTNGDGSIEVHPQSMLAIKKKMVGMFKESEWIGQINDKIEVIATFTRQHSFDSMYGTKWIYIFEDDNSNLLKWSTSKPLFLDEGQKVSIKGTVKDHSEFRDEKQTDLTRCKVQGLE